MNVRNPLKYHINKANTGSMVYHTLHKKTAAFKDLQTFKSYFKVRYSTLGCKIQAKDIQSSPKRISLAPWLFCKSWRYKSMETYFQLCLFWSQYPTLQLGKWRLAGSREPNQASEPLAVVDSLEESPFPITFPTELKLQLETILNCKLFRFHGSIYC